MNYSKERKEKNEKAYSEICDLTKKINDMAKDAVIETLKECDNQMLAFPDDGCLWGRDVDNAEVKVNFISLTPDGKVHYSGYYEDGTEISGEINDEADMVSFDWSDVLYAINASCDFVPEYL